ncbi:MAG: DUF4279 domain-containing protein [Paracoccaceae bacterium]
MTEALGREPDASWRYGEPIERGGVALPIKRRSSTWRLNNGRDDTQSFDEHLDHLMFRLTPHREALLRLATRWTLQVTFVAYVGQGAASSSDPIG